MFIMLSGALILNEHKEFSKKIMFRYVIRLFTLLYVWSLLYAIVYKILLPITRNQPISYQKFLNAFIFGHFHQWYLFMMIGLYLMTPILKKFVSKANADSVLWFIILSLVFQFMVPLSNAFINHYTDTSNLVKNYLGLFRMDFVCKFTTYYILGWYITNINIKKKNRCLLYMIGFIGLVTTILGTQVFHDAINASNKKNPFYSSISINILVYSVGMFIFLYYFLKDIKFNARINAYIKLFSNLTFGVYLIHPMILTILDKLLTTDIVLLKIIMDWFLASAISFLIVYIMSRIPLVKKFIKC